MAKIDLSGVEHDYELTTCPQSSHTTVVFIHGWLLSREYWRPIIDEMSEHYPCLSYDLRGFGNSNLLPKISKARDQSPEMSLKGEHQAPYPGLRDLGMTRCTASAFSPASYAHDLLLLLDKLSINNAWLIGHSLGGTIAVWTAAMAHRNNIQGLICLNSGGGIYVADEFEKFRKAGSQILKYRPQWLAKLPGIDWIFCRSNVAQAVERRWGQQLVKDFLNVQEVAGQGALLDSTTREEVLYLPQIMKRLALPTYFIAGNKDTVMEPKYVQHLASFHQMFDQEGSNLFQLENCGHLSMIEKPNEVSQILNQILKRHYYPSVHA